MADPANSIERKLNQTVKIGEDLVAHMANQRALALSGKNARRDWERKFGSKHDETSHTIDSESIKSVSDSLNGVIRGEFQKLSGIWETLSGIRESVESAISKIDLLESSISSLSKSISSSIPSDTNGGVSASISRYANALESKLEGISKSAESVRSSEVTTRGLEHVDTEQGSKRSVTEKATPKEDQKITQKAGQKVTPNVEQKAEPTATPKAEPTATPKAEPAATQKLEPTVAPKAGQTVAPKAEPSVAPKATPTGIERGFNGSQGAGKPLTNLERIAYELQKDVREILSIVKGSPRDAVSTTTGQSTGLTATESRLNELFGKAVQSASAKQVSSTGASGKTDDATASAKMTPTEERLTELFGKAEKRDRESSDKLDELFGKTNTQLTGINTNIEDNKKHIISLKKFDLGGMIMGFLASPVGLMMLSFVGGFAWGWLNTQGWFQTIKKAFGFIGDLLKNPTVQKILAGGFIAVLVNHLTGGLLFKLVGPLIGLVAKGVGALLFKGLPALLKFTPVLLKGLMAALTSPVGAAIATFAATFAAGYAGMSWLLSKLEAAQVKENEEKNKNASKFESAKKDLESNKEQVEKLQNGDDGGSYVDIKDEKGRGAGVAKGYYDEEGNFHITEKMNTETGKMEDVSGSGNVVIPAAEVGKKVGKKTNFNFITERNNGMEKYITQVDFGKVDPNVKRGFMSYIATNYVEPGEIPGPATSVFSGLVCIANCYLSIGAGLSETNNEDLQDTLVKVWNEAIKSTLKIVFKDDIGFVNPCILTPQVTEVWGKLAGYMVPKSMHGALTEAVKSNKFIIIKKGWFVDDRLPNHMAYCATIYQIWVDVFLKYMNSEFGTEFKNNTISQEDFNSAMAKEEDPASQSLAIATQLGTEFRTIQPKASASPKYGPLASKVGAEKIGMSDLMKKQDSLSDGVKAAEMSGNVTDAAKLREELKEVTKALETLTAGVNRAADNAEAAKDNSEATVGLGAGTLAEMKKTGRPQYSTTAGKVK